MEVQPKQQNNKNNTEKVLREKEALAIEYYTEPKSDTRHNWYKSYLKAGYSKCKGWQRNASKVLSKKHIKEAIKAKRDEIAKEISVTREYCIQKLIIITENSENERNVISAISTIGDFAGFKRENAPNQEKEQARKDLKDKEAKELERIGRQRTSELADGPKIVKVG